MAPTGQESGQDCDGAFGQAPMRSLLTWSVDGLGRLENEVDRSHERHCAGPITGQAPSRGGPGKIIAVPYLLTVYTVSRRTHVAQPSGASFAEATMRRIDICRRTIHVSNAVEGQSPSTCHTGAPRRD